jgi:hypothetical protein
MGLVRHLFGSKSALAPQLSELELPPVAGPAPTSTSGSTPAPTSGSTPTSEREPTPAPEPPETLPPTIYAVRDAAGIVVDLSHWITEPESPATHAEDFLDWLVEQEVVAGQYVLEKALRKIYTTVFCPEFSFKPMPWPSILRRFSKLINGAKIYKSVYKGGRRRRLRAYRIPLAQEMARHPGRP